VSDAGDFTDRDPAGEPTDAAAADATTGADGFSVAGTPPPESDDKTFARLAKLPLAEYERARDAEATRMGFRVTILDKLVEQARGENDAAHGRGVALHDPEPWPEPVTTAAVLDDLASAIRRHVIVPASAADALPLWIAHTWVADRFENTPRLGITSPTRRCGKSTLLELLRMTCRRTIKADNISASGVFRTVESLRPLTLLIDEADSFLPDAEELRGVLNSGFERSGNVVKVVEIKGKHQPIQFATFAPCALATISDLPSTLADRAIPIRMERKAAHDTVQKLRHGRNRANLADLARKLARWAADTGRSLSTDPAIPEAMGDREGDISVPLLAIADRAGRAWADRGRRALLALFRAQAAEDGNSEAGTLLLGDIRVIFTEKGEERLPSVAIVAALAEMESRPWPEWKAGKPITVRQLARVLAPFGVRPGTYRPPGGAAVKGYFRDDFAEAWNRYLSANSSPTAPKGAADPLHGNIAVHNSGIRKDASVTPTPVLPTKISESASPERQCYRVTDQIPAPRQAATMTPHDGAAADIVEALAEAMAAKPGQRITDRAKAIAYFRSEARRRLTATNDPLARGFLVGIERHRGTS
jgi:hypothetical protein